jgi:hypothetical protein
MMEIKKEKKDRGIWKDIKKEIKKETLENKRSADNRWIFLENPKKIN